MGSRERHKRRVMGIAALAAGAGLAFALVATGMPRLLRVFVFFPVWIAALGLFQAREKTCIAMAARGTRNMDGGEERIDDRAQIVAIRIVARRIHRRALITAAVVTLAALAFPA